MRASISIPCSASWRRSEGRDGAPQGLIKDGGARQTIAVFAPDSIIGSLLEEGLTPSGRKRRILSEVPAAGWMADEAQALNASSLCNEISNAKGESCDAVFLS